ncbi:MAG: hypothetical protein Q8K18_04815 [Burkholderiales bacterium]|nr:hypothetical protein [Burkholderiales bacterium]
MTVNELQVAVDVGARTHRVAVGDASGRLLEEFDLAHTAAGLSGFFERVEGLRGKHKMPVAVAIREGTGIEPHAGRFAGGVSGAAGDHCRSG